MCNCNQQRSMFTSVNNQTPKGMVKVKLTENKSRVLNGDITGRAYIFRTQNDFNWVDKRDAMSMTNMEGLQIL